MQTASINTADLPSSDAAVIADMALTIEQQNREIRLLKEKIDYLLRKRFSTSSERFDGHQGALFDDLPEAESPVEDDAESASETPVARKAGGRRRPPEHLPRIRVVHDLDEADKQCACGVDLVPMGEEISEQYDVIPPVFRVLQQVRIKYCCPGCGQGVKTAQAPAAPLPRHQISPGLLAYIGTAKFVDGLPLNRQAQIMGQRFGVPFNRTTLADWAIKGHEVLLKPVIALLRHQFLCSDYAQADETTLQVLDEPDRGAWQKSYLWLRASLTGPPIVLIDYRASRAGAVADELLMHFSGYLQTDGYAGYNGTAARKDVTQLGCWAHARRKFDVAAKSASGPGARAQAQKALGFIRQLYAIERLIKNQSPEERKACRDQRSRPLLAQFRQWIDETLMLAETRDGLLKTAYTYLVNQWPKLLVYLEDGRLHIDNNHAERFNRPIAQGRKQWLFAQSEAGAHATAAWYSVIATAKANGWEPYHYLKELFTRLPQYLQEGKPLDDLMPWAMPKPDGIGVRG